jgi:hypothetical protein
MSSVVLPKVKIGGKCYIQHDVQTVLEYNVHKLLLHNITRTFDNTLNTNKSHTSESSVTKVLQQNFSRTKVCKQYHLAQNPAVLMTIINYYRFKNYFYICTQLQKCTLKQIYQNYQIFTLASYTKGQ